MTVIPVRRVAVPILVGGALLLLSGSMAAQETGDDLPGTVRVDGSSTMERLTGTVSEAFRRAHPGVGVTVRAGGTGDGFAKLCAGETDVANASRPIAEAEAEHCAEEGVDYVRFPVASDGITVVVNSENDWARCVTVEELRQIWGPESTVDSWGAVRDAWPDRELLLFGRGGESGTFDYFTKAITGEGDADRADQAFSDPFVLMSAGAKRGAMGYVGFASYVQSQEQVKALEVDNGDGCVAPTTETIRSGAYAPLKRPLFVYVREQALERPEVRGFVDFYLENARQLVPEKGYVPLDAARYDSLRAAVVPDDGASLEAVAATDTVCTTADGGPSRGCAFELRRIRRRLPESVLGLRQIDPEIRFVDGLTAVRGLYSESDEELGVLISSGKEAWTFVRENMLAPIESRGASITRTHVGAVEALAVKTEEGDLAGLVGHSGGLTMWILTIDLAEGERGRSQRAEEAFERLHRAVIDDSASMPEEGSVEESRDAGRRTVTWEGLSLSLVPPAGWAVQDLGELTGGMLPGVVLMRDREVAERRFGPDWSASTEDTFAIGSPRNVFVSLSPTPVDPSRTDPAAFLDGMDRYVGELLPDGEVTGDVRMRATGEDSLPVLPFRGQDRDGRTVRGWMFAVPIDGALLQGQVMSGPEAPAAAVDSAMTVFGTVRRGKADRPEASR